MLRCFFLPASLDFLLKGFNFKTSVLENLITQRRGKSEIFMGGLGIFAALGTGGYTIYGGGVEWQVSRGCVLNLQFQFENNKLSPSIKSCARKAARLSYPRRCLHCCPLPSLPVSLPSHRTPRFSVVRSAFSMVSRSLFMPGWCWVVKVLHYAGDSIAGEKVKQEEWPD